MTDDLGGPVRRCHHLHGREDQTRTIDQVMTRFEFAMWTTSQPPGRCSTWTAR